MIHFNSPDHVQERANVEPLSLTDMEQLVEHFNMISHMRTVLGHEQLQRLIWEYENLKHASMTAHKWISVDDALPEEGVDVLVHDEKMQISHSKISEYGEIMHIGTGVFNKDYGWHTSGLHLVEDTIRPTHWMPLPIPPNTK